METRVRRHDQEFAAETPGGSEDSQSSSLLSRAEGLAQRGARVISIIEATMSEDSREFLRQGRQEGGQ